MDELSRFLEGQDAAVKGMEASFRAMKWGVAEVKAFINGVVAVGGKDGLVTSEAMAELETAAKDMSSGRGHVGTRRTAGNFVVEVKHKLRERDRQYLRDLYLKHVLVDFAGDVHASYNPHPVVKSSQVIMDALVWRLIPHYNSVLEVGPNIASAVSKAASYAGYVGVSPILDSLDAERHATSMRMLRLRLNEDRCGEKEREIIMDALRGASSHTFRRTVLQEYRGKHDIMIALHAVYGISFPDLVRAVHCTGVRKCYFTMVNLDSLYAVYADRKSDGDVGKVGQSEMMWRFDRRRDEVVFFFEHSTTRPYKHRLSQLMDYFRGPRREFVVDDRRYIMRRLGFSTEVECAWVLEPVVTSVEVEPLPGDCVMRGDEKSVVLTTQAAELRYRRGDPARFKDVELEVGQESFTRVLQDRLARGPGKVNEVISYARTNRVNVIYNGVRVSCERPVAVDALAQFAGAIDALACQLEQTAGYDVEYVMGSLSTGGWRVKQGIVGAGRTLARSVWRSLLLSMSEVAGASVSESVSIRIAESVVQEVESTGGETWTVCHKLRDARTLLEEQGAALSADDRLAVVTYARHLSQLTCLCTSCVVESAREEENEVFYDVSDSTSDMDSASTAPTSLSDFVEQMEATLPVVHDEKPPFVTQGLARDAAEEFAGILKDQMRAREDEARLSCERIEKAGFSATAAQMLDTERVKHWVLEVHPTGKVLSRLGSECVETEIGRVYDPGRDLFMSVERDSDGNHWVGPGASALCYTNSDLSLWLNPAVLATVESCLEDPRFGLPPARVPFLNGIWGSGKSFLAKQWFRSRREEGAEVYFLGSSRRPTEEVREDLFPGDDKLGRKYVRTLGSVFQVGLPGVVDELVVDEVCMEHAAVLYVILWKLRPKRFWVAGDWMQMEYVPFLAGCRPKYASLVSCSDLALLQKGHRVPDDVYAGGLRVYGEDSGIHPCDCEGHERGTDSLEVVRIHSLAQVPIDKDAIYITHGQATKKNMLRRLKENGVVEKEPGTLVVTMAEFQGGTREKVIIVREVVAKKPGTLYHELHRNNVGFSRSTGSTRYYTMSHEVDMMVKLMKDGARDENRAIVAENKKKFGEVRFGLAELVAFIDGNLDESHPALVAGRSLKDKLVGDSSL